MDRYVAEIQYNPSEARGILRNLKSVTAPAPIHCYPRDIAEHCPDYLEHQKAWQYRLKRKSKDSEQMRGEWKQVKPHDDLEWCERAHIVAAATAGLIGATIEEKEEAKK